MRPRKMIFGMEVGNAHLKLAALQPVDDRHGGRDGRMKVLLSLVRNSQGIQRGEIVDTEALRKSLSDFFSEAEEILDHEVKDVLVVFSPANLTTRFQKGNVIIGEEIVTDRDMRRVLRAAQVGVIPPNREIIEVVPQRFTLDNVSHLRDPIGMAGSRLEVDVLIVDCFQAPLRIVREVFESTGARIRAFGLSLSAIADVALSKRDQEIGTALVDFGSDTISVGIFEHGHLSEVHLFNFGGNEITNELAIRLKTSVEAAEAAKVELSRKGCPDKLKGEDFEISKKNLKVLVEKKLLELLRLLAPRIKGGKKHEHRLPGGIVFASGGALCHNLIPLAKKVFNLPARLARDEYELFDREGYPIEMCAAAGIALRAAEATSGTGMYEKVKAFVRHFIP